MTCSSCNYLSYANDRFCTQCGHALFHIDGPCASRIDKKMMALQDSPIDLTRSHQLAGISDRGLWHSLNEDAIAVEHLSMGRSVLIVCDGVSSSTHPEQASSTAVTIVALALAADLATRPISCPRESLASAMSQAQQAVARLAVPFGNPHSSNQCLRNPPATTIVAALIQTDDQAQTTATIGWLGDSRAYWISSKSSQLLTRDDSWLNAVRLSGRLTEAEAESPYVHAIIRWLGANDNHLPSMIQIPLNQAGYLILCSDGFWNYATEPDRVAELCSPIQSAAPHSAHTIAQTLVYYALSCGGRDNISVAVYYHEPQL